MDNIIDICNANETTVIITEKEVEDAIATLKPNKSHDVYKISSESIKYGGEKLHSAVAHIVINAFRLGLIPEILKTGLLTPVFKNKGSGKFATNYRGITIMPVLLKLIEIVAKARVQPNILNEQSMLQRGFTKNTAPMNCSFFLEELAREFCDLGKKYCMLHFCIVSITWLMDCSCMDFFPCWTCMFCEIPMNSKFLYSC